MKKSNTFNFNRFGRFAKSSMAHSWKQTLLLWGAIAITIFISVLVSEGYVWNFDKGSGTFLVIYLCTGSIYAGFSFSHFRSKERTMVSLMTPITPIERLVYEFLERIVLFIIIFPIIFFVVANLTIDFKNMFEPDDIRTYNDIKTFPFVPFSFRHFNPFVIDIQLMVILLLVTTGFAGGATFQRYPHIKTALFLGAIFIFLAGVLSSLEWLNFPNPWVDIFLKDGVIPPPLILLPGALLFLITLIYVYFRIKEKEVI